MEPIVSPWFIYFLFLIPNLAVFSVVICTGALLWGITAQMHYYMEYDESYPKLKRVIIIFVVALFLSVFIPTKETIIGMYVAKTATYDNVGKVVDVGSKTKDALKQDLMDIIQAVQQDTLK